MFYIIIEVQQAANGTVSCLTTSYTNEADAYAKLYTVLATAAKSSLPYHACHVLREGMIIDGKVFDRRGAENE